MVTLKIKIKDYSKAVRFKKHLEEEHPSTRGKIQINRGGKINMAKKMEDIHAEKEPKFREISFEGNMPSTYEKNLKKALDKKAKPRRKK